MLVNNYSVTQCHVNMYRVCSLLRNTFYTMLDGQSNSYNNIERVYVTCTVPIITYVHTYGYYVLPVAETIRGGLRLFSLRRGMSLLIALSVTTYSGKVYTYMYIFIQCGYVVY